MNYFISTDFRQFGVGVSQVWIKNITSDLNNVNFVLISDVIIVSIVLPISIEAHFEKVPPIEISFKLYRKIELNEDVKCGRIKLSHEYVNKNKSNFVIN